MDTPKHQKQSFNSHDLEVLDLALAGALATAKELGIEQRCLEAPLGRRLFTLAGNGITDPEILQVEVLKSMNIDKIA